MIFLKYLKDEIRFAFLLALVSGASYYISLYLGWKQPTVMTNQDIGNFLLVFIVVGALLRYILHKPPRDIYDVIIRMCN